MRVKPTEEHYNRYIEHPPFYVTKDITTEKDGQESTEKKLSSYMECHDVLIGTPLFEWYKEFVELGAEMRRSGTAIAGNLWKLMLNAGFGKMAQNNAMYENVFFTKNETEVNRRLNKPTFKSGEEFTVNGETLYQVNSAKQRIKQNMPIQGACMILIARISN